MVAHPRSIGGYLVPALLLCTGQAAAQVLEYGVVPRSIAHTAFMTIDGEAYLASDTDADGDGRVVTPLPAPSFGMYYRIEFSNGAHMQGCDGTFSMPMAPGEVVSLPGFYSTDGVPIFTAAASRELRDSGVVFVDGQTVLVEGGFIAETPLIMIKDATELIDPKQLLDSAFVHSLPMYSGEAVYREAGRYVGPESTGACCVRTECSVRTETACADAGGVYRGDGSSCDPSSCAPACPCDWDGSQRLNSQDFFVFLRSFFDLAADFNGDGETTSQDLFDFLACFFLPPPDCG